MKSKFGAMKTLITLLSLAFSLTSNATTYYFSTSGNDANNGTSTSTPWKTLSKFNSISGSLNPGDNVLFNRGNVFYGSITIKKSGTSSSPITLGAYGTGAMPVITGFTTVSAWTNLGSNIWESTGTVSALSTANLVVINGINTGMGRYPNTGYLTYQSYSGFTSITSSSLTGTPNWTGADIVLFAKAYVFFRAPITAQSGGKLTYTSTITDYNHNVPGFFIENDARTLDVTNEWYYNPSTKKLRVYNTSTPTNVQVTTIDTLVKINAYNYITFDNISFQGANGNSIVINTSKYITIQNCDINFSGKDAIYGSKAGNSIGLKITNCTINHSNSNGVDIGAYDNATIQSNTIKNSGVIPGMTDKVNAGNCVALNALGATNLIGYNTIDSAGYSGIQFLGNNTSINNNYISNTCLLLGIGGGIYTWNGVPGPTQTGIKIKNNLIINYGVSSLYAPQNAGFTYGLFFDDWSNNIEVSGNTEAGCGWGICLHNSYNMTVLNNTTYNNSKNSILITGDDSRVTMTGMQIKNNIFFAKNASDYTLWYQPPPGETLLPSANFDSNYYARPMDGNGSSILTWSGSTSTKRLLSNWQTFAGQDLHSKTSPKTITTVNDLRFEYNETTSNKTIALDATYIDVKNVSYNGTITLAPFTSAVLIKNGAVTNKSPIAKAGNDQTITLPTSTVSLSGSGTDPDGTISAYSWTKISGPTAIITTATSAATTVTALLQGVYKFQLKVTDNIGAIGLDTVQVTVNAAGGNIAPTSNAGPDQTVTLPTSTTTLSGSGTDPDGTIASYSWKKILGPSAIITKATSASTGVTGLLQGVYQFQLQVTDNKGATALDIIQITVNAAGNLLPAVNPANTVNGLDYKYFESAVGYSVVPNFSTITPVKTGSTTNFNISLANKTTMFAFNFSGFITVPSDGQYTFYTTSDDGSNLLIDNVLVVNNDGLHSSAEKSGTIGLKAGKHAVSVGYFQQGVSSVLSVSYAGPGISKKTVPASAIYRISGSGLVGFDNDINQSITASPQVGIKAYPNPFTDYIEINITGDTGEYKLILVDAAGRVVWTKTGIKNAGAFQQSVNTSTLERGIYFLKVIQQNTANSVIKLVK